MCILCLKGKVQIISVQLRTGGKFKEIQNANEMSRNTALTMLSHPVNEHLAHFFVSLVARTFLQGCTRKKCFFTASKKSRSNYKSYLSIT